MKRTSIDRALTVCLLVVLAWVATALAVASAQSASSGGDYGKPGAYYVQPKDAPPPPDPLGDLDADARRAVEAPWEDVWQSDRDQMNQLAIEGARTGPIMTLPLDGDRVIHLVDDLRLCESSDRCLIHSFDDLIVRRYYVVSVLDYESSWSYLIDRRTGTVHKILSNPLLSADESFAIAISGTMGEEAIDLIWFEPGGATVDPVEIDETCASESSWAAALQREWDLVRIDADRIELHLDPEPEPGEIVTRLERRDSRWRAVCSRK